MSPIGYLFILSIVCLFAMIAFFSRRLARKAFKKTGRFGIFLVSSVLTLVVFFSIVKLANRFLVTWHKTHFYGMSPGIREGDLFFVKKFDRDFERADIVTYLSPSDGKIHFSRILALPGESVSLKGGFPLVNGQMLDETSYAVTGKLRFDADPMQLGPDEFFVLEDYREDMFTMTPSSHIIKGSAINGKYWYTWYRSNVYHESSQ